MSKSKLRLVKTCDICPEQYDLFYEDKQIGYFRVRHGYYRVDSPYAGSTTVYATSVDGVGAFADHERDKQLLAGIASCLAHQGIPHKVVFDL